MQSGLELTEHGKSNLDTLLGFFPSTTIRRPSQDTAFQAIVDFFAKNGERYPLDVVACSTILNRLELSV